VVPERLSLPEHMSSSMGFVEFVFQLVILLSVLLRSMDSDYPINIGQIYLYFIFYILHLFLCSTPLRDRKYGIKVGWGLRLVIRQS
jgi:hypothetical protein